MEPKRGGDDWANLDPYDAAAIDRFVAHAIEAGKRAGAEAVARLLAAGIPVPYSDGNGEVAYRFPLMANISPIEVRGRKVAGEESVELSLVDRPLSDQ